MIPLPQDPITPQMLSTRWLSLAGCLLGCLLGCVPGGGSGDSADTGVDRDATPTDARPIDATPTDARSTDARPTDARSTDALPDACQPDCTGRSCGPDGCGGTCGQCEAPALCDRAGACVAPPADCGDGRCGADEDCATCPADCGDCCGDTRCDPDEDCATCATDCACPAGHDCLAGTCQPEACADEGCGAPPRILIFNANVRELTEAGAVVLSAIVTDPDGIADLIGGVLEDPTGAAYGAFVTAGEEGAYELTLTWAALHAVTPIEFAGTTRRSVIAVFFDQAGNRTTSAIELTLHCRGAGDAACDGRCASLDTAENCGACRALCGDICRDGICQCPDQLERCDGICRDTTTDPQHCGECDRACPDAIGGAPACDQGQCQDPCPGPAIACDGTCTDPRTDPDHCGACDRACDAPARGTPTCVAATCDVQCDPGHRHCDATCAPCPAEGVTATACDADTCVAAACNRGFRVCDGRCARCPEDRVRETTCAADRCIATRCDDDFHPCAEGCCPWRIAPVGVGGTRHALTVDAHGVHLAIGDRQIVRYAHFDGARWTFQDVVRLDEAPQNSADVTLASDGDTLHLAYAALFQPPPGGSARGILRTLRRDPDGWRDTGGIAGLGGNGPSTPSLALDHDTPWLVWDADRVRFASPIPHVNGIAISPAAGWNPHLKIFDGEMHIAWWNVGTRTLGYARGPIGAPILDDPQSRPRAGLRPRIAIDGDGHPTILHRTDDDEVLATRRDANGQWQTIELFDGIQLTNTYDITTAPDGTLLGCLSTPDVLYLLRPDGAGFIRERITGGGATSCELAFGPDGALHLVFVQGGALMHAY